MAIDYAAIANDQARLERTAANSIRTLANLYAERAHFVFELLQNAEDALRRRPSGWRGSRTVNFQLASQCLRVSHYGEPFNAGDVQAICSVGETTKELTDIGRFGIGFKSVYAFTDRPRVHSGLEDFAITDFVRPVAAPVMERDPAETVILIPLKADDASGHDEIARGIGRLGASALLFLRQIEEIHWSVEDRRSGLYLREPKEIASGVRRVTVVGQEQGKPDVYEEWLVFSNAVAAKDGQLAGHVELAFSLTRDEGSQRDRLQRVERSPLVVFFPTVLETHLGFLVQGPYRTTPSRDNVPRGDTWNQRLVSETASLLGRTLCWLRDNDFLDGAALRCLPLDSAKFGEASMFASLYNATKSALSTDSLLPRFDAGHVPASRARLGRTQELRDLFTPTQLAALYGAQGELVWLSGDITQDRTPELRRYLMQELEVPELTPETIITRLDRGFLEAQTDPWIGKLYEFLGGQPGLLPRLKGIPLIRLEDGSHVSPSLDGQPQAFLPGPIATGFPVVRATVCASSTALAFLKSLGLTQPDPVDDVVRNLLPKYREDEVDVSDADYESDIGRIVNAFGTDSKGQREKLLAALRVTPFVMAVDVGDASEHVAKPGDIYVATERLQELFASVPDVLLADNRYPCLRGEDVRELLEACGAVRYLRPIDDSSLSLEEKADLRTQAGHSETSGYKDRITDWALFGLTGLLDALPGLTPEQRRTKARLLWEELAFLEERRGKGIFTGEYAWTHYGSYRTSFDAAFVRALNNNTWVPDQNGNLQRPALVPFDSLGWKANPFLLSKIRFKPAIVDQLAKELGIEPGVLDLLKKLGVTSEADLRARLGVKEDATSEGGEPEGTVKDALKNLLGDAPGPTPPVSDPTGQEPATSGGGKRGDGRGAGAAAGGERTTGGGGRKDQDIKGRGSTAAKRTPGGTGGRPFISYVGTHRDEEEPDPDGLDQLARMALEARAIDLIVSREPEWRRTTTHNPGFDLYQGEQPAVAARRCEVKAMTGSLADRPVGLSSTQFECAREHRENYWLYVVEHAGDEHARIVRIQDPAGKARTFTFDHGWINIAETDSEEKPRED